jgi:hypothetical protein
MLLRSDVYRTRFSVIYLDRAHKTLPRPTGINGHLGDVINNEGTERTGLFLASRERAPKLVQSPVAAQSSVASTAYFSSSFFRWMPGLADKTACGCLRIFSPIS